MYCVIAYWKSPKRKDCKFLENQPASRFCRNNFLVKKGKFAGYRIGIPFTYSDSCIATLQSFFQINKKADSNLKKNNALVFKIMEFR
jgi:hypothetical protein